jgi:hypothetical protein
LGIGVPSRHCERVSPRRKWQRVGRSGEDGVCGAGVVSLRQFPSFACLLGEVFLFRLMLCCSSDAVLFFSCCTALQCRGRFHESCSSVDFRIVLHLYPNYPFRPRSFRSSVRSVVKCCTELWSILRTYMLGTLPSVFGIYCLRCNISSSQMNLSNINCNQISIWETKGKEGCICCVHSCM